MPLQKVALAACVGNTSRQQIGKFERFNIEEEKSLKTATPILKEADATFECKLVDSKSYGGHIRIVGEVVAVNFLEESFTQEDIPNPNTIEQLLCLGSVCYISIDQDSVNFTKGGLNG